jgi:hypothetical protein
MQVIKLIFIVLVIGLVVAIAAGCSYKKDVVQTPCVLADSIFYSSDVVPILQANCYRCHSSTTLSSGILLDNYNALKFYAQNGYLYGCIAHLSGYPPMPADGGKLSDCNIALIKKWIDTGTPQ